MENKTLYATAALILLVESPRTGLYVFEGQLELLGHQFAILPLRVEIELNRKITEIKKLLVIEISYPPLSTPEHVEPTY